MPAYETLTEASKRVEQVKKTQKNTLRSSVRPAVTSTLHTMKLGETTG